MFFVQVQKDVTDSSREPAQVIDMQTSEEGDSVRLRLIHRTKAAAIAAMQSLVPEGEDPWVYASLRVMQTLPDGDDILKDGPLYYLPEAVGGGDSYGWKWFATTFTDSDVHRVS